MIFNQRTRQRTRKLWGRMWCWKKFHYNYFIIIIYNDLYGILFIMVYIIILCFWWPATFSMLAFCKSLHRWSMLKHPEVWEDIHPWICPACQDMPRHCFSISSPCFSIRAHIIILFMIWYLYDRIGYDIIFSSRVASQRGSYLKRSISTCILIISIHPLQTYSRLFI